MSNDDELVETLVRLGRVTTPRPDPAFANQLDSHLRTLRFEQEAGRSARSVVGLSLAGLAGVVLIAVLSFSLIGGDSAVVVMTAAADTDVVLPGEAASPGVAGQQLPDGTRIVVSSEGEAVVGGVVLGPGAQALVVGGRIEVLGADGRDGALPTTPPTRAPAPTDPSPSGPAPDRTSRSGSTSATRPDQTDRQTSTSENDRAATSPTTPGGDDEPVTTPTPTVSRPTTATTPPATTVSVPSTVSTSGRPRPEPSIELRVNPRSSDRIVLEWVLQGGRDPEAWQIEAVSGDRVVTLAVLRDGTVRTATVSRIDARTVGFRVAALDADGSAVLRSEVMGQPAP